ncbi:MAG: formyltransferase family protein [Actinobacteria bacterium]|nr:formyltransferase family protein [Actinomycetota bacterium]
MTVVDRRSYGGFGKGFDRDGYSRELAVAILGREPSLIAMAGFGTVVAKAFHEAFPGRILNTHPALLPAFPGWHGVEDALAAGVPVTGCTVHIAGLEVDSGPSLAQGKVEVRADDTVESLHERIKEVERRLYPETIAKVLEAIAVGAEPASLAGEQVA